MLDFHTRGTLSAHAHNNYCARVHGWLLSGSEELAVKN